VRGQERPQRGARRLAAGGDRLEHAVDRVAQLAGGSEVALGPHVRGQHARPPRPGHEVRVSAQVVDAWWIPLDRVGKVEREVAAPELDRLDRARYHQN
jgi:hypothetical protein